MQDAGNTLLLSHLNLAILKITNENLDLSYFKQPWRHAFA